MSKNETGKTVKVKLYKDSDRYKQDVQVIVNGKAYVIKRGVTVEVPDFVAEVLENAQTQAQRAIEVSESIGRHHNR